MTRIIKILKSFKRSPMLLFVNLPGLAIGLAAFILLMIYVVHESSFDQHFPTKSRVYRLYNTIIADNTSHTYPICSSKAYTEIPAEIPEIEKACQFYRGWQNIVSHDAAQFTIKDMLYVNPEFFDVFGLELLEGDKQQALEASNQLVITQSLAQTILGTEKAIGQTLNIEGVDFVVTGVIADFPKTTHFQFDALTSMKSLYSGIYYGGLEFFTYYLLTENADPKAVEDKIAERNNKVVSEIFNSENTTVRSGIEPLTALHLHTRADFDLSQKGSMRQIILVAALAAFILLIAIINFINLYIFQGEKRLLEIGIRKSYGATPASLRRMFFLETALIILPAFALALLLAQAGISYFSQLMWVELSFQDIISPSNILMMAAFLVLLVFLAGSYPAHFLSRLPLIDAVQGGIKSVHRKKWLSVSSVVVQFFISILLIVSLLVLYGQISYMKNIPLGFNPDKVVGISNFNVPIHDKADAIKQELQKLTFVEQLGSGSHYMGGGVSGQGVYLYGQTEEKSKSINQYRVQPGFCEVMELQLAAGRFFRDTPGDKSTIILNQSAVKMLGLADPVGQSLIMHGDEPLKIIGVVEDFYYNENAGQKIEPLCLTAYLDQVNVIYLKISGELTQDRREAVAKVFQDILPDYQFSSFSLGDRFAGKYAVEDRFFSMVLSGTILAIFLSFIGMYALSGYNVERRTKEIGIRKVHGSSTFQVVIKLLNDILIWVVLAMIPAFLVAYIAMRQVLMNFVNKVSLSPFYFLLGGIIALTIATLAILYKTIVAANQNPVESLRDE
ncbi:MAG: ABC transporter permease [Bacteroidales bacterium]|jgi:putative ABC transport system permease protein|nr:ABC transporter permease [Bacteroidales bacterium]